MKLSNRFLYVLVCVLTGCLLVSCSDVISQMDNAVDGRIVIDVIDRQSASEALSDAIENGKIVKSILPITNGGLMWIVEFSDSSSLHFYCNSEESNIPYLTIGSDSCWYVSRDYGESYQGVVDSKGNEIKAVKDSIDDMLNSFKLSQQEEIHSLLGAFVEDNISHALSMVMANGDCFTLPKTDNILCSFSFMSIDNEGILPNDLNYCVGMNRLTIVTPYVIDKSHLIARFSTSPQNKVLVNGQEQTSGVTENDFTNGVNYQVLSPDGQQNVYGIRIQNTGLPVVSINTPNGAAITSKKTWLEGASITIYNPDGSINYESEQLQIRGRGNSTWSYPKKPYALKLEKKAEILGMPKHKRWVLLANWMDKTLLRNEFAFEIARHTGLAWTPRGLFVEVILNGDHIGNYYLCEQIKIDKNRVNIKEMTAEDIEGDALTGGYLMELDVNYDEVNKFKSAIRNMPYMFKNPDEEVLQPAQLKYFQDYINQMETWLYAANWLEKREYADCMDLGSFADWWFVYELSMNGEPGHPKSSYVHKDRLGKLTAGPVWDFDWGTFMPSATKSYRIKSAIYYKQLFNDPQFVALVKERWNQYLPAFESIPQKIRQKALHIRHSERFDHERWPFTNTVNDEQNLSFMEAVDRIVNAYQEKLKWLDKQIQSM